MNDPRSCPFTTLAVRRAAAVGALAVVAALASAVAASAAYAPRLTARSAGENVSLSYTQPSWQEGAAVLTFYAPAAYEPKLTTSPGANVGSATVRAVPAGGATPLVLRGAVRVASATTPLTGSAATVGDATKACTGSDASEVLWLATLSVASPQANFQLPISVQKVGSGMLTGRIAVSICPPPADVPPGTAGRAPLGLKIVRLTLGLQNVFDVPEGTHVWNLRATPYAPGHGVANGASSVEAEARHGVPQKLTFFARRGPAPRAARVAGRLTLAGDPLAAQTVTVFGNGKRIGTVKTDEEGRYAASVKVGKGATRLRVQAKVPAQLAERCFQPAFASLPCTGSIRAGFTLTSPRIVVRT
jgi:hypothetical protein